MTGKDLAELSAPVREQKALFDRHIEPLRPALWRYCHQLTGSAWEAEDLVQDTLLKAFARLATHWQPINPKAYLFRIASRTFLDHQRSGRPETQVISDDIPASQEADLSELGYEALERLVRALPPLQRVVTLLTQAFDFSSKETADVLDTTEGAVNAALYRARQNLVTAEELDEEQRDVSPLVQRFADAFNAKDVQALRDLLTLTVVVDIVGVVEERGRDNALENSLKLTLADEDADEAVASVFDGRDVVLLLKILEDGSRSVSEVWVLQSTEGAVTRMTSYYFSPDFLAWASEKLELPSLNHGYRPS